MAGIYDTLRKHIGLIVPGIFGYAPLFGQIRACTAVQFEEVVELRIDDIADMLTMQNMYQNVFFVVNAHIFTRFSYGLIISTVRSYVRSMDEQDYQWPSPAVWTVGFASQVCGHLPDYR